MHDISHKSQHIMWDVLCTIGTQRKLCVTISCLSGLVVNIVLEYAIELADNL